MGVEVNAQSAKESEYVSTVNKMTEEILHDFSNKVIRDKRQQYRKNKIVQENDDLYIGYQPIVGQRFLSLSLSEGRKMAFLDLLLESSENGGNLTDEEIREEIIIATPAGHDTTSAAISWLLHTLSINEECQEKIYKELESIFGESDRTSTL
ncbi:hypothetical protein L9F63_026707 [Diploptera punctata]|uniref:Cytochrome P450 n=1 Tax=Diploptera punctata TaxID=6984 RepID=A0AAD8AGS0_DIPPU|nr:hypothetical protein L9F63_026707 [Diploptera punctata]